MPEEQLKPCHDCGVAPGEFHTPGCDVERCAMCGYQAIGCDCIYKVSGIDVDTMEDPTDEMYERFDAEIEKLGGRLPWTGHWPNLTECQEYGFWCYWVEGKGWVECSKDHPEAREDLNRLLSSTVWDRMKRRFVLPGQPA